MPELAKPAAVEIAEIVVVELTEIGLEYTVVGVQPLSRQYRIVELGVELASVTLVAPVMFSDPGVKVGTAAVGVPPPVNTAVTGLDGLYPYPDGMSVTSFCVPHIPTHFRVVVLVRVIVPPAG